MKYTADEARKLKAYGEIPENGIYSIHEMIIVVTIENADVTDAIEDDNCVFDFDQI